MDRSIACARTRLHARTHARTHAGVSAREGGNSRARAEAHGAHTCTRSTRARARRRAREPEREQERCSERGCSGDAKRAAGRGRSDERDGGDNGGGGQQDGPQAEASVRHRPAAPDARRHQVWAPLQKRKIQNQNPEEQSRCVGSPSISVDVPCCAGARRDKSATHRGSVSFLEQSAVTAGEEGGGGVKGHRGSVVGDDAISVKSGASRVSQVRCPLSAVFCSVSVRVFREPSRALFNAHTPRAPDASMLTRCNGARREQGTVAAPGGMSKAGTGATSGTASPSAPAQ
eukprot:834385-Rhodomonas_salina.1